MNASRSLPCADFNLFVETPSLCTVEKAQINSLLEFALSGRLPRGLKNASHGCVATEQ